MDFRGLDNETHFMIAFNYFLIS